MQLQVKKRTSNVFVLYIAAIQRQPLSTSMPTVFGAGTDFLDITDYIFLDDDVETERDSSLGFLPDDLGPDCTGIVLHSSSPSLNSSAEVSIAPAPILSIM